MASNITVCPSCGTKNRVPVRADGRPRCASCHTDLPWVVDASDATLGDALGTDRLVILDLWAPWCGPCRMVSPILEQLAADYAGRLKVVKVNVDDNPQASMRYKAQSIPMMVYIQDGEPVETVIGAQPERVLRSKIDAHLG